MTGRVRTFAGYREYRKYHVASRYFVYKQALLAEADHLVAVGVLREREDIFYLTGCRAVISRCQSYSTRWSQGTRCESGTDAQR